MGTWKDGAYAPNVEPGDAVVWAGSTNWAVHVGMVTEVLPGNQLRVIHGNWENAVKEVVLSRGLLINGAPILGYASPRR